MLILNYKHVRTAGFRVRHLAGKLIARERVIAIAPGPLLYIIDELMGISHLVVTAIKPAFDGPEWQINP